MKISFIIPVYNGETTIGRCIDSIIKLQEQQIEIIVIDDGSTDETSRIVESLKEKDHRIHLIKNKNSGVSVARNVGMSLAQGKYIAFVDADDWILSEYEELIKILDNSDNDFVVCDYLSTDKEVIVENKRVYLRTGINNKQTIGLEVSTGKFNNVWSNIYLKDIIHNNNIKFREGMKMGEDGLFNIEFLKYCKSYYYHSKSIYMYIKDVQYSAMHKYNAEYLKDHMLLFDEQMRFLKEIGIVADGLINDYLISRIFGILYYSKNKIKPSILEEFRKSVLLQYMISSKKSVNLKSRLKIFLIILNLYKSNGFKTIIRKISKKA